MERITISIDAELLAFVDRLCEGKGYGSRSEAIRDMVRDAANAEIETNATAPCVATLTYLYDHETRDLARRLTDKQHNHHDLSVATLHVHLDRHECLEVTVLRGQSGEVRSFADGVISQRGVRHGHLQILPDATMRASNDHDH